MAGSSLCEKFRAEAETFTTATVVVNTIEDVVVEGPESFIIRVANPVNGVQGAGFEASGTIIDDD